MNKPRPLEEEIGTDDYSQGVNTGIFSSICFQNRKTVAGKSFDVLKNRSATNYLQLVQSFARITEVEGFTPDKRNDRIRKAWLNFVERREDAFLFGKPADGDVLSSEEKKRTKTGGFVHWMESSPSSDTIIDVNGRLSESLFMELIAPLMRDKPGEENSRIVAICGSASCYSLVMLFPEEAAAGCWPPHCPYLWRIEISDNVRLEIYRHLLLDGYGCENSAFLITPEDVGMRTAERYGCDPCIRDISRPEYHYVEEEIFAVEGFWMDSPELHRIIRKVKPSR